MESKLRRASDGSRRLGNLVSRILATVVPRILANGRLAKSVVSVAQEAQDSQITQFLQLLPNFRLDVSIRGMKLLKFML